MNAEDWTHQSEKYISVDGCGVPGQSCSFASTKTGLEEEDPEEYERPEEDDVEAC